MFVREIMRKTTQAFVFVRGRPENKAQCLILHAYPIYHQTLQDYRTLPARITPREPPYTVAEKSAFNTAPVLKSLSIQIKIQCLATDRAHRHDSLPYD